MAARKPTYWTAGAVAGFGSGDFTDVLYGGTGADLSATGGSSQYVKQTSAGGAFTVGVIAAGDLPTGIDAAKINTGVVSNAEFNTLDGINTGTTIQAQLDAITLTRTMTNNSGGSITLGMAVYKTAVSNEFAKAQANARNTSENILGILLATTATGNTGAVQVSGFVTLTTVQWDAQCGTTGGLTPGTVYYLSASTAGQMTSTAPTTSGQTIVTVLLGITSTIGLLINDFKGIN